MGKGWRAATRSEYRKVEELTLAGFFVITLLVSTISGVEVPSLRRALLRRSLAGSAKVVKRTKVRRQDDVSGEERRLNGFGSDGEKIADKAIARCFGTAIAFISMRFNLIGHVLSLQEREGDEEPLRGCKAVVYLRDRQQRDLDGGLIAELSRHMLCADLGTDMRTSLSSGMRLD
ncbi:hypothetical protein ALC60_14723 [Trachymyrmex zeteki]|uniref:Uncharacterized protein n=1 Tax=Mycetomoellerius zeteki TaxID=64791 RepID=A0A151WET2_9HYME|nr:hypothetical protein ALC60_14723 [Trachymyrmex zeteki]